MQLTGDMNLQVADSSNDSSNAHIKTPFSTDFGFDLQFKQHPDVAEFALNQNKIIALQDLSRAFPVGQVLAMLKWCYAGQDESYVPLSGKHPPFSADRSRYSHQSLLAVQSQPLVVSLQRWHVRR